MSLAQAHSSREGNVGHPERNQSNEEILIFLTVVWPK